MFDRVRIEHALRGIRHRRRELRLLRRRHQRLSRALRGNGPEELTIVDRRLFPTPPIRVRASEGTLLDIPALQTLIEAQVALGLALNETHRGEPAA